MKDSARRMPYRKARDPVDTLIDHGKLRLAISSRRADLRMSHRQVMHRAMLLLISGSSSLGRTSLTASRDRHGCTCKNAFHAKRIASWDTLKSYLDGCDSVHPLDRGHVYRELCSFPKMGYTRAAAAVDAMVSAGWPFRRADEASKR